MEEKWKKKKTASILMLMIMALSIIFFMMPTIAIGAVNTENIIFNDDFENIDEGVYPSVNGWNNLFSGKNAYVSTEKTYTQDKSFRLEGYPNWARMDYVDVDILTLPDKISYEAAVFIPSNDRKASVGFMEGISNMGPIFNAISLNSNGNITWIGPVPCPAIQECEANKWYKVRADIDFISETADIYIDDQLKTENVPAYPKEFIHSYWGNIKMNKWGFNTDNFIGSGTNVVYFDDVVISGEIGENKPDLTVTQINYNPQNPEVGDYVTVGSAVIKNKGTVDCSSQFNVALYINDNKVKTVNVDNLAIGESKTIDFDYQWKIDPKQYIIKVVVDDSNNIEESNYINNIKDNTLEPKPWLKITTDKSTYKGDGEEVIITVEYYTPNENDYSVININCDGHIEYTNKIDLSTNAGTFTIDIPALPVYNNNEHVISGHLSTSAGPIVKYYVEPTDDVDMIILTNPKKLYDQFNSEDWRDILYDIQHATDDGGILLYTDVNDYAEEIGWLIDCVMYDLNSNQGYNILYLFILGGDDVIPYQNTTFNEKNSTSDQKYWDFGSPDHIPDFRYSRLTTTNSSDNRDLDRYLNKKVFNHIFNKLDNSKIISSAIIISGRDALSPITDKDFKENSEYIKIKLQSDKENVIIDEYALSDTIDSVKCTYERNMLNSADLIYLIGHGHTDVILMDNKTNYSVTGDRSINEYKIKGECLSFYNNLSNDPFKFWIDNNNGTSDNLLSPIVFASSCLTANRIENNHKVPLSEIFMHFNAGSYAGYGTSVNVNVMVQLSEAYSDQLVVNQDLGSIFYNSMYAMPNKIKNNIDYSKTNKKDYWMKHFLQNLDYFIQLGYPKWNIDPDEAAPDYSNPILPNYIDFDVINYNISTFYDNSTIEFNATLNGDLVNSTNWILQGNPIVPYIHLVYDLPEQKTVESLTFETAYSSKLGQYNITMFPGTYSGQLYEYFPLNLTAYMEQPVEWKVFKKTDGNMTVVLDIFPFQYYPDNGTVIFHNNFTITTSERERTASINSISTDKKLYVKGDTAQITVNCTGSALINLAVEGSGLITQQSTGSDIFTVDTGVLPTGSHDIDVKLYNGDSLLDEMLTSISVVDKMINMSLETSVNSTFKGSPLELSVLVTNLGGNSIVISPDIVIETENTTRINFGNLALAAHESKLINTVIDTTDISSGMVIIYAEEDLGTITVGSSYEIITLYEDVSNIIIEYQIEPEVIYLSFSNPYVDNVHYSLDDSTNISLYEPYNINISSLAIGSTHNITVYADDVFGNENSTTFQFIRKPEDNNWKEEWTGEDTDGGTSITTTELQDVIHHWLEDIKVKEHSISITDLQEIIVMWLSG